MTACMPIDRLVENEHLVAFYHPKPAYKVHILIVPKKEIRSLDDLTPADAPLLGEIFSAAKELVGGLGLEQQGYRLLVNGGVYQDVKQIHFHLVSD